MDEEMKKELERILKGFHGVVALEYANLLEDPQQQRDALDFIMREFIAKETTHSDMVSIVRQVRDYRDLTPDEIWALLKFFKDFGVGSGNLVELGNALGQDLKDSELSAFRTEVIETGSLYCVEQVVRLSGVSLTHPELAILFKKCLENGLVTETRAMALALKNLREKA